MSALLEDLESDNQPLQDTERAKPDLLRQVTFAPTLKKERGIKCIASVVISLLIIGIFLVAKIVPNLNLYKLIALILCFMVLFIVFNLSMYLLSFNHLHFMRIKRRQAPNATVVFIPYGFEQKHLVPFDSISALLSLRGSNIERSITTSLYSTFVLIFCAVLMKWNETDYFSFNDVDIMMLLLSSFGIMLVATWNLEGIEVKLVQFMHYISVVMILAAGIGLCIYTNWSVISIIIMIVNYLCFVIWILYMTLVVKKNYDANDKLLVHKHSLITIILEMCFLVSQYVTYIYFIFSM